MKQPRQTRGPDVRNVMVLLALVALSASAAARALDLGRELSFEIPSQPLPEALLQFSKQASVQILTAGNEVSDATSPGVSGRHTIENGLKRVLEGTGFRYEVSGPNTISVVRTSPAKSGAAALPMTLAQADKPHPMGEASAGGPQSSSDRADAVIGPDADLGEIVVLGSRIARAPGRGASPTVVLTREDIDRSGAATIHELLSYVTQIGINTDESGFVSFRGPTTVQLRGLSIGTTLILVNGRRVSPSGTSGVIFNLSTLPMAAIERVEVLADGASAIYGADALAGVVNFVLKRDIDGIVVDLRYGDTSEQDAREAQASLGAGFGSERASASIVLDYFDREALPGANRERTANADYRRFGGTDQRSTFSSPLGTIYARPGSGNLPGLNSSFAAVPAGVTGAPTVSQFEATAGQRNLGSRAFGFDLVPASERAGALLNGRLALTEHLELAADILASSTEQIAGRGPDVVVDFGFGLFTIPASNPFNPFGVDIGMDRLLPELGEVTQVTDIDFYRATLGLAGDFTRWSWSVGALWSREETDDVRIGQMVRDDLLALLANPDPAQSVNLFTSPIASATVLQAIGEPDQVMTARVDARQIDALLVGPVLDLPAGPLRLAFGAEARKEELVGDIVFLQDTAERDVVSAFLEFSIPLLGAAPADSRGPRLELSLAGRVDDYSDFGDTTNPKVGLEYEPIPSLSFRATYGTSFKAPTLRDLYDPQSSFQSVITDPVRGESYVATVLSGGNPDTLDPEEGDSYNIGIGIHPRSLPGFELNIDAWNVAEDSRISRSSFQSIVLNEGSFPGRVVRGAPPAPGEAGPILSIDARAVNFGRVEVQGIDFRGKYVWDLGGATLGLSAAATYVDKYEAAVAPGAPAEDRQGRGSLDGYATDWRGNATFSWAQDGFTSSLTSRYVSGYHDYPQFSAGGDRIVDDQTLFDVQAGYQWVGLADWAESLKVTLGVINALDEEPPFSNQTLGFDPRQADLRGRFWYLRLGSRF